MKLKPKHIELILQSTSKSWLERKIAYSYKRIYQAVLKQTLFLGDEKSGTSFFERLFCIQHELSEKPLCKTCHLNYVKFNVKTYSYQKWCSPKCQASDPECVSASKKTRQKLYGNANYNGAEKSRQTRKRKNNGNWHSDDFWEKVKARKIANGHDPNWVNPDLAKKTVAQKLNENPDFWKDREKKSIATHIKNGHDAHWNNREKFKKTLEAFSCEKIEHRSKALSDAYQSKSDSEKAKIIHKRKNTCLDLCGYFPMMLEPHMKEEIEQKMLSEYGVKTGFQLEKCRTARNEAQLEKTYGYLVNNTVDSPNFNIDMLSEHKKDPLYEYEFICRNCKRIFKSTIGKSMGIHGRCPVCFPPIPHGASKAELELADFIKTLNCEILQHDKKIIKPLELDIVIPSMNVAIEYDGLYWHSEQSPNYLGPDQHVSKTNMCNAAGYDLIHVFENEWTWRKEIVKSAIAERLNLSSRNITAENCEVKFVDSSSASAFLTENCIFGNANSSVNVGLYYNDELVSVMAFCKSRFDKKYEWEILRTCNKLNVSVKNAESRMLMAFEQTYNPKSIITRVDRRWCNGKIWECAGFTKIAILKPDYWFFQQTTMYLYPKTKFKYSDIKTVLAVYDSQKTVLENMLANKWRRIFDCGKFVFIKEYVV